MRLPLVILAVLVALVATPVHADPATGKLAVFSMPSAKILIDGKDIKRSTPITSRAPLVLPAGRHKVTFVVGAEKFSFTVTITAGQLLELHKQLPVTRR